MRLLRSSNAPWVITFLEQQFKRAARISVPFSEAQVALSEYQRELQADNPSLLPSPADYYLSEWCSPEVQWLFRRYDAGSDEPVLQLSPHTEKLCCL